MKTVAIALAVTAFLSFSAASFASSWDMVGKVLTGIEGARILTGGRFDVIGNAMDAVNIRQDRPETVPETVYEKRVYVVEQPVPANRIWVPTYCYRDEWVPAHWEYNPQFGRVFIEGHYVTYKLENGGYWAYQPSGCGQGYRGRWDR